MDLTTALAIWGAATGTVSVAVQVAAHRRDRPQLAVGIGWQDNKLGVSSWWVNVANQGRQPTTLIGAGFLVSVDAEYEDPDALIRVPARHRIAMDNKPVLLRPGQVHQFKRELETWPDPLVHADIPLRPYVEDSHGRTSWGSPGPFLRRMVDAGWDPPTDTDPELLRPIPEPLFAEPVTARWKLWRPSYERRPMTGLEVFETPDVSFHFSSGGD